MVKLASLSEDAPRSSNDDELKFLGLVNVTMSILYTVAGVLLIIAVSLAARRCYRRRKAAIAEGEHSPTPPELPQAAALLMSLATVPYVDNGVSARRRKWYRSYRPVKTTLAPSVTDREMEASQCCICISDFQGGDVLRKLPCCHHFHSHCIERWLRRSRECPLCKADVYTMVLGTPGSGDGDDPLQPVQPPQDLHEEVLVVVSGRDADLLHDTYIELDALPTFSSESGSPDPMDLSC